MRIAIVQTKPDVASINNNHKKILEFIQQGIESKVELICFAEMSLCAYDFSDLSQKVSLQMPFINRLKEISVKKNICICVGGIEASGKDYFISQFVINKDIKTYRKTHLGQKERLSFKPGDTMPIFESHGHKFGIMTCYDSHFPELALEYALQGAEFILNPTATPNLAEKRTQLWSKYLVARAYDNRVWIFANNLLFNNKGGGMMVYDSNGDLFLEYKNNDEHMEVIEVEFSSYSPSMKNRLFNADRRVDLYGRG